MGLQYVCALCNLCWLCCVIWFHAYMTCVEQTVSAVNSWLSGYISVSLSYFWSVKKTEKQHSKHSLNTMTPKMWTEDFVKYSTYSIHRTMCELWIQSFSLQKHQTRVQTPDCVLAPLTVCRPSLPHWASEGFQSWFSFTEDTLIHCTAYTELLASMRGNPLLQHVVPLYGHSHINQSREHTPSLLPVISN